MPSLPPVTFERRLQRLDAAAFRRFVADLWTARGWSVDSKDPLVAVREGEQLVIYPVGSLRSLMGFIDHLRRDESIDVVATPGGYLSRVVKLLTAVLAAMGREPRFRLAGPTLFYEWSHYALDTPTRGRLLRDHLDYSTERAARLQREVSADPAADSRARRRALLLVTILLASGFILAFANAYVSSSPPSRGSTGSMAVTVAPTTTTPLPVAGGQPGTVAPPEPCSAPPLDASPADLRPRLPTRGNQPGLDSWTVVRTQEITRFDHLDEIAGVVPESRFVGTYTTPSLGTVRLEIDRWRTINRARADSRRDAARSDLQMVWGRYAFALTVTSVGTPPNPLLVESSLRVFLGAVGTPTGGQIGTRCVDALLDETGTGPPKPP